MFQNYLVLGLSFATGMAFGLTLGLAVALRLLGQSLKRRDAQLDKLLSQRAESGGPCWVRSQVPPEHRA